MTILALLLAAAIGLAWWGLATTRTADEFFVAGHRAGTWLVGIAGTAAGVSAFTFVGGPGLFAVAGVGSLWIILSAPLTGALQCWAVGEPVMRLSRRRPVLTVPELMMRRFASPAAQGTAAAVVLVGCIATLAVQARAAVVLGEDFLGLPGAVVAAVVLAATAAYSATGGMRASLLADAFQGGVMGIAGVVLAVAALAAAGGPTAVVEQLSAARPDLLGTFGSVPAPRALAWYLLFCIGTCAQPHYIQKFLLLRSADRLRGLPAVLTGALAVVLVVWLGVGLAGTALVSRGSIAIARGDDLAPRVMAFIGPWAMAVAGAVVLAAVMSTSASLLNMAAAAVTRDAAAAFGRRPAGLGAARVVTVAVALAATAIGVTSQRAVAILGIAGWGFFTAALLAPVTIGLAWARATGRAVVAAMACGAVVDLALESVRSTLPAGLEPGLAGAAVGTLVLVFVSLLRQDREAAAEGAGDAA